MYERREVVSRTEPEPVPDERDRSVRVIDEPVAEVDRVQATAYDPFAQRRANASKMSQGISLLFGVIETLLALRFILRMLGANPDAGFAQGLYGVTAPFVAPFVGLFGTPAAGGSVLELHTVVAIIVYALVGWLLTKLVWLLVGETRSATRTTADTYRTEVR